MDECPRCDGKKLEFSQMCRDCWIEEKNKNNWRNDPKLRKWRKKVLERDGHKCVICAHPFNLHVHHIFRGVDNPDFRYKVDNGITLCAYHHRKTVGQEKEYEEEFKKYIKYIKEDTE